MYPCPRLPALPLLFLIGAGAALAAAPAPRPFVIANSQIRPLPPSADGRHYELDVHLPGSYAQSPGRRYPVLYVTDGYWDFPTVVVSYDNLAWDRAIPEFIIVGIGYADEHANYNDLRRWELPPVPLTSPGGPSGHAAEFLRSIKDEIIPFVEREYRVDPSRRVLAGSSLGGLFALYAMYTEPDLFQGYIAASPAVRDAAPWIAGRAEAFARSGRPLPARLYLTTAENEWPDFRAAIEHFHDQLAGLHYPGFAYQFRRVDGMRHSGTKAESYARGMAYVFAPEAPETGPMQSHPY
ncbi:MAG TPA: alpha/beta hydrolase-fold protein [Opitutaceae bacterium]|nr:alpha/beta hydrolase-fold protein [Opitutaceae bacterium]